LILKPVTRTLRTGVVTRNFGLAFEPVTQELIAKSIDTHSLCRQVSSQLVRTTEIFPAKY
jgi:hypothetical protein